MSDSIDPEAITDEMTDAEVNVILQRYNQTEPALQRRIVAQAFMLVAKLRKSHAALRESHEHRTLALVKIAGLADEALAPPASQGNPKEDDNV